MAGPTFQETNDSGQMSDSTKAPNTITRRDILNGIAVGIGVGMLGDAAKPTNAEREIIVPDNYAPEQGADYYPPAQTGLRGDHDGSFGWAHKLRKGVNRADLESAVSTGENFDLVVVGGGISGLAAAYFYQQRLGATATILILENHDDFGGHATRNEFSVAGRLLLSYGGSQSIASPGEFSEVSQRLMRDLGIDMEVFEEAYDHKLYSKLGTGLFFDRETFGRDQLLTGMHSKPWSTFLKNAPLPELVRRDIVRVYTEKRDYMPGLSVTEKTAELRRLSYKDYLIRYCHLDPAALLLFQTFPHDLFAVGIDAVSAWSCYHGVDDFGAFIYPGFDGLGLPKQAPSEPYIYHFPDGNASVARLLVRALIPTAVPGNSMHDVVLSKLNYAALDHNNGQVRIRLNSTVLHARHRTRTGVEVVYAHGTNLRKIRAKHCIFACYNAMIPYICPELPREQRKALSYLVRMPLVYTHVVLRNWTSFAKLGVHQIVAPAGYHNYTALDFPVSWKDYQFPKQPEEPAALFMLRVPCRPGLSRREQNRIGRWELLNTPLATFEHNVHDQLGRMLDGTGFDPSKDIMAITVNRWAHGYSFIPNRLFDPEWTDEQRPWVIGRRPWGQFAIANSDAGASAYMDVAIDQASRAVDELMRNDHRT
jgi:spermidine dehydrogenase